MHSFKRFAKPLIIGTVLGLGGYSAYQIHKKNADLQKIQKALGHRNKVVTKNQSFQNITTLLEQEENKPHTEHQKEDLALQKQESYQKKIQNELQKKQEQQLSQSLTQQKSDTKIQILKQKQANQNQAIQKQVTKPLQSPQSRQQPEQKKPVNQQEVLKNNEETKKESQIQKTLVPQTKEEKVEQVSKPVQVTQQKQVQAKQKTVQKNQQNQEKVPEPTINLSSLHKLSQLPHIPLNPTQKLQTAIVVADMGFTEQFQQKLLQTIKNLKHIPQYENIKIYRMNLANQGNLKQLQKVYGHKIKDETIFLIKNELDQSFVDINFDMYMQYPTLINTYLTRLNLFKKQNGKEYLKKLQKMGPNQSYIMFVYDDKEPQEKRLKSLLAAKYIEMELALHHLDHVVKVLPVEAQLAKQSGVIPEDKIRSKSLHIIRKHNQFTHTQPNLHLKLDNQTYPYHLLADIGFHNKRGQVAIQSYLSKIETFNSLSITTPYILSVTIDKNRISTDNYKKIMDTFRDIKRKNLYPQVGIALKFAEVGYLGKDYAQNNEFCIKLANVAEMENQTSLHEIHNIQDAKSLGITQENWLMNSNQFLYPHHAISETLINDFVQKALSNQIPQYYRSDKPSSIQNVHKIVASNFDHEILQNSNDHFVFEFSDHCPSCKLISPLIGYINEVLEPIPVKQRFDIHVMNCQKNRVKGQVYSPYTPNMSYYKNEWKHTGPVKIGLESIKYQGLVGLYDFCLITKLVKTIDGKKFQQAINNAKGWNRAQFLL